MIARILATLALLLAAGTANAHKPSDSYLTLRVATAPPAPGTGTGTGGPGPGGPGTSTLRAAGLDSAAGSDSAAITPSVPGSQIALDGRWDIALRDLDFALGLDTDGDGHLTWDEVRTRHAEIAAYALARLRLAEGCQLHATGHQIDRHTDGAYAVLLLRGACRPNTVFTIDYRLFADLDAQHRGLASITVDGVLQTAVLGGDRTYFSAAPSHASIGAWRQATDYLRHGIWHIWTGYDHILFLLSLLLPAVLATGWKPAASDVLKVITAFTLAHSITLSLAALNVVSLPSRWVESAIAASVAVAALNNVWPLVQGKRWLAAFAFGLLHGFGFAGVLGDLGLPQGAKAFPLAAFNIGVELGQLAIVAAFVPLAYAMRSTWFYKQVLVRGGSVGIALLALVWVAERAAA